MIQVYKILNDCDGVYPEEFLELNDRIGRKNSLKLFKRRCKPDLRKYIFTFRVVDQWNGLPEAVVQAADVNAFKRNYDHFMRDFRGQL